MPRYVEQKQIKLSCEDADAIIEKIMNKEEFLLIDYWDGTQVWIKNGWFVNYCFYIDAYDGVMNIEAWVTDAIIETLKVYPLCDLAGSLFFKDADKKEIPVDGIIGNVLYGSVTKNITKQICDAVY